MRLVSITDTSGGRSLQVDMDPIDFVHIGPGARLDVKIRSLTDWTQRVWRYDGYTHDDKGGWLPGSFTAPGNRTWKYKWVRIEAVGRDPSAPRETFPHLASVTDPQGHETSFEYSTAFADGRPRVISQTAPDQTRETYTYQAGQFDPIWTCTVERTKDGVPQGTRSFRYDRGSHRGLIEETDTLGRKTTYVRDQNARLLSRTDPLTRTWRYTWDGHGNMTSRKDPDNNTWSFEYHPIFNLLTKATSPITQVWTYGRDTKGNLTSIQDPLSHVTNFAQDAISLHGTSV